MLDYTDKTLKNLVELMPRLLKAVLQNNDGHKEYSKLRHWQRHNPYNIFSTISINF